MKGYLPKIVAFFFTIVLISSLKFMVLKIVCAIISITMFIQSNMISRIIINFTIPFHLGGSMAIIDKNISIDTTFENIVVFYNSIRTKSYYLILLPSFLFLQKMVYKALEKVSLFNNENCFP